MSELPQTWQGGVSWHGIHFIFWCLSASMILNTIFHFKTQNSAIFCEGSTKFIVETFVSPACLGRWGHLVGT